MYSGERLKEILNRPDFTIGMSIGMSIEDANTIMDACVNGCDVNIQDWLLNVIETGTSVESKFAAILRAILLNGGKE